MAMYSVSKRFKEFGIRVALGAQAVQLIRVALGRPLIILLTGSAAGIVLGALASKLLAYVVYQATPYDPVVLIGVMLTMAILGLLSHLDPRSAHPPRPPRPPPSRRVAVFTRVYGRRTAAPHARTMYP